MKVATFALARLAVLVAIALQGVTADDDGKNYTLGLLVKSYNNEFFRLSLEGCNDFCRVNRCSCLYEGARPTEEEPNPDPDGAVQAQMLIDMIPNVDAVAISVKNAEAIESAILQATLAGIPIVTFDSDAPNSVRTTYVGTDNTFMGTTLAKVAKQISPNGGNFVVMASDDSPNMLDRIDGFQKEMLAANTLGDDPLWTPLGPPGIFDRDVDLAVEMMHGYAEHNPAVVVSVNGGPMWSDHYADMYRQHKHRNITIVFGDDFPLQINYLSRGYVSGLVGQMPYEMGSRAAAAMLDLLKGRTIPREIGTNLISHLQVPLVLPELSVDHNLIGNLKYVSYVLYGVVVAVVATCIGWTVRCRKQMVVQSAQPVFLILVAIGVLILGGCLVPLAFDDDGDPDSISENEGTLACMSVPWLGFCGFTITFSALYSKTRRVTMILESAQGFQRIKLSPSDVLGPFCVLLTLNVVILTLWTVLDPLRYVREANPGFDGWNRVISTYGSCRSDDGAGRFLIPLALVNASVLALANHQAYLSRKIKCEFAESKYIAFAMVSLLQAFATGFPVVYVVRESPDAYFLVMSFMIFIICMSVLLLIFVPKMLLAKQFSVRTESTQRRLMMDSVLNSRMSGGPSRPMQKRRPDSVSMSIDEESNAVFTESSSRNTIKGSANNGSRFGETSTDLDRIRQEVEKTKQQRREEEPSIVAGNTPAQPPGELDTEECSHTSTKDTLEPDKAETMEEGVAVVEEGNERDSKHS